jgi:ATP-dependent DNA helicase DinG
MARAVGAALARGEPLIIEAGTGIGKTFAYLVPALLSGRSIIISTGTRTLQDQLYRRDLPLLARALGMPVQVALLKGRANYLCRHRLTLATQQRSLAFGRGSSRVLARVMRWAALTKSGDLAELTDLPEQSALWPQITSTRENCLGQECAEFARCHVIEARRAAQAAQIVVVNHHLLLADLALKEEGFGDLLPGADALILDEAHQVPDIAAQFFGESLSTRQIELLARDLALELKAAAVRAPHLDELLGRLERDAEGLRQLVPGASRQEWAQLPDVFLEALGSLERLLRTLAQETEALGASMSTVSARRALTLADTLATLAALPDEAGLKWVDVAGSHSKHASGVVSLSFTPFEIADRLSELIHARPAAWVFTSATLAVGDDFTHFAQRIGVPDARHLKIDSPFDYRTQARLYLPRGMPDPQDPRYAGRFIEACAPLLEASGGRAFILYTSHRGLQDGVIALRERFPDPPFPVLVQGQAPREELLRQFRLLGNAVLLATGSFWEGVDVKGEALAIVAIDKLPFASPDDPLLKARLEGIRRTGGNPFIGHQLPQAVLTLKQGVGRLIRDFDDFGVIVLGDPRLTSRSYGRLFLEALPPCPVITEAAEGARFLRERLARAPRVAAPSEA